jgi:hypothetical protein
MTSIQELRQVLPRLLIAIRNDEVEAFYHSFSLLVDKLARSVSDGTASSEELLLMDEAGAAVESVAGCFLSIETVENSLTASIERDVVAAIGSFLSASTCPSPSWNAVLTCCTTR